MGAEQSAEQMRETTYEVERYSISAKSIKIESEILRQLYLWKITVPMALLHL